MKQQSRRGPEGRQRIAPTAKSGATRDNVIDEVRRTDTRPSPDTVPRDESPSRLALRASGSQLAVVWLIGISATCSCFSRNPAQPPTAATSTEKTSANAEPSVTKTRD